jgi:hypothetical protein
MLLGGPPAYVDMACIRRECRNRCSTGDGNRFAMSWTKSNGPPVQPPEHQGFGTTVTDTVVKQTLGSEVQLDYTPLGFGVALDLPGCECAGTGGGIIISRPREGCLWLWGARR